MRIDKISFKNINSLQGEHAVDFSVDPLKNAGIFAIIGPTGSGKSTLLDVITLALYNQVPRISAKSISDTVVEATGSILTRNTDDAYATIEYTTRTGSYISTWSIRRNRNGKLVSPHMDLVDKKDGKALDLKKSQVPGENERLIGLSYDQFVKSIILSQGEFAKFLKADKNDRGKLLEKITGTGIYRQIGAAVYERFKEMEKDIEGKASKSELIELLTVEEIKEINTQIEEAKKSITKIDESLTKIAENKKVKELIVENTHQRKEIEQQNSRLKQLEISLVQNLKNLDIHEKLNPYRANIALCQDSNINAKSASKQSQSLKERIAVNEKKQAAVIAKMSALVQSEVTEKNFSAKMKAFETKVLMMDNELKTLAAQGVKIARAIKEKAADQDFDSAKKICAKSKSAEFIDVINSHKSSLQSKLAVLDLDPNQKGDTLLKAIESDQKALDVAKEVLQQTEQYESIVESKKSLEEQAKKNEKTIADIKPAWKNAQTQLVEFKDNLKQIRLAKDKSKELFDLNALREDLVEGVACPLCGAVHHPLAAHQESEPKGFELEIKKTEKAIAGLEIEEKKLAKQHATATADEKNISVQLKDNKVKIDKLEQWFKTNDTPITSAKDIFKQVDTLSQKIASLKEGRSSIVEYQWLQSIEKEVLELVEVGKNYASMNKQRQQLFTGKIINDQTDALQDEFSGVVSLLQKDKGLLAKSEQDAASAAAKSKQLYDAIWPNIQQLGFANFDEIGEQQLSDKDVQKIKSDKESFNKQSISLQTQSKSLALELEKLAAKDTSKESLETITALMTEQSAARNKMLEDTGAWQNQIKTNEKNQKTIGKIQKELDKLKLELDHWALLNRLIGDKTGTKFSNYAQNITLKHLLGIANRRLKNLFDRYLLDMPKDDGELMIVDTYQGHIQRGVSTLSGGESFMVSLALALSLSDMASKNVVLESLFIDEGFSTLDPEMLDLAMNTLDKIQSETQKTVGIISHVDSLKERIDVQIQLDKNAHGYSTIRVEG